VAAIIISPPKKRLPPIQLAPKLIRPQDGKENKIVKELPLLNY
jgi:hypothetical protein